NLDLTRTAPGRPEVEQYDLSFIIRQAHELAVGVFQSEIGSRLALVLGSYRGRPHRLRGAATTHDQSKAEAHCEKQAKSEHWHGESPARITPRSVRGGRIRRTSGGGRGSRTRAM